MAAFCAICIDGVTGLRPRQLTDGGPIYIICEECDERDPAPPFHDRGDRPVLTGRNCKRDSRWYRPLDEVKSDMAYRILETVRRAEWSSAMEIADLMGVPGTIDDPVERNRYSASLSRLRKMGYLERRKARSTRAGNSWDEYRITERGIARLENAVRCAFQRMRSIAA